MMGIPPGRRTGGASRFAQPVTGTLLRDECGRHASRLTDNAMGIPPGRRTIAFHSDRDGNADIYVMNADGTGVVRLTRGI